MPKMKSHKGSKKRFKITKTGKVISKACGISHLLTHKKRSKQFHKDVVANEINTVKVMRNLPYGEGI